MWQAHAGQPLGAFVKYCPDIHLWIGRHIDTACVLQREESIRWIDDRQEDDLSTNDPRNQRAFPERQPPFAGSIISQKDCPVHDASGHLAMMKDALQTGGAQSN
jgi:hypothetical protein